MTRPLDLTVHERDSGGDYNKRGSIWLKSMATRHAERKRFTDAELAAEFWKHEDTFNLIAEGYGVETFGTDYACGSSHEELARDRLRTIERFATHPHHTEQDH